MHVLSVLSSLDLSWLLFRGLPNIMYSLWVLGPTTGRINITNVRSHKRFLRSQLSEISPTTVWPSGLRRWLKAPVRKGVGSNPTAVIAKPWEIICLESSNL